MNRDIDLSLKLHPSLHRNSVSLDVQGLTMHRIETFLFIGLNQPSKATIFGPIPDTLIGIGLTDE